MGISKRRVAGQVVATSAVLGVGVVTAVVGGGSAGSVAHAAPRPATHASAPTASPSPSFSPTPPPLSRHDQALLRHHINGTMKRLSHPTREKWSRLLAPAPRHAVVTHPAAGLTVHRLSREFAIPQAASRDLRFDGYRRGVNRGITIGRLGAIEEIWQFRQPAGAAAWYLTFTRANQPGSASQFDRSFAVGAHGARGYLAKHVDSMGYHFGEGVAIEGDMIVRIRLYGTSQVRAPQIRGALLRAAAPVARGIRFGGLFGQILGQDTTTPAPTGV